ncbi:hypothetical protein T440DRAFT_409804 [Plenodomus tracheiphilus IPT5]|uniref:Uncharacterized protein n=1 Tax=Plenodomus tracheiphilus IPT5 TaxID=1408161 RepID=A0A6A7APB8_9PLEO|nr:hypothetical protein T440DRAFT_409804 [Plenodomus tracheiphilus IPT5]
MSKRDFFPLFLTAWEASFKEQTILKAFEATGLSPFNPEIILQRFNTRASPSGNSDSSALSASNWRKTEGLLREVVKDRGDPRARKLSQAFHSISVQKTLLEHEVQGLREALINERLRRKRGKALPLQEPEDYHGGAIFYSPRKVKEARERQQQQELEEEQQRLQKAEKYRRREEARQAKAQAAQARREARASARLLRERLRAERAADQALRKAARKTAKRLQESLKLSQRGKRRSLKATRKAASEKFVVKEPQGSREAGSAATAAQPIQSRCGRQITTPARYI